MKKMKKKILCLLFASSISISFAQTGINTKSPKTTLEVVSNPLDVNKSDGIILPKLTGNQLKAKDDLYDETMEGTIVFVTEAASPTSDKTINVTRKGEYYFNGEIWLNFTDSNIYNSNGILSSNRTVDLDDKSIAFTSTTGMLNQFSVGLNTFSVDTMNHRIGMGTSTPTTKLHIVANTNEHPLRVENMKESTSTDVVKRKILPVGIDENGVLVTQYSPITIGGVESYSVDGEFTGAVNTNIVLFDEVTSFSVVLFEFNTNQTFGNNNSAAIYGSISFTVKNGFQISPNWTASGNSSSAIPTLNGIGSSILTFQYPSSAASLIFSYSNETITVRKSGTGTALSVYVFNGRKLRK